MGIAKSHKEKDLLVWAVITALLFVYLLLRSVFVPFTHDEAATFFHYVHLERFFTPVTREAANNHYLNTLLTYLSYKIFGSDTWALRLPNTIFSLLFFYYWFRTSKLMSNRFLQWGMFLVVSLSIWFLDFFALSRGYGLSVVFFTGAVYHTILFLRKRSGNHLMYSVLFVMLSLSANLSMTLPVVALLLLHVYGFIRQGSFHHPKRYFSLFSEIAFVSAAVFLLLRYREAGALYFGTPDGGLVNAVNTWIQLFTGSSSIFKLIVAVICVVFLLLTALYRLVKDSGKYFASAGFVFDFLFFATLFGAVLEHLIFGVYYPEGRTGLYFLPLFAGSLFFAAESIPFQWKYLFLLPLFYLPFHFFLHLNFGYANAYKDEVIPYRFYQKVASDTTAGLPTIGGYHMGVTTWAYINYKHGGRCNQIDWTNFPEKQQDYQLFDVTRYPGITKLYDTVDFEPVSNLVLLKRKYPVGKRLYEKISIKQSEGFTGKTFYNLKVAKKEIEGRSFLIDLNFRIASEKRVLNMWIVVQAVDKNGKSLIYKYIPIDWLRDFKTGRVENIHQSIMTGMIPQGVKSLKIYLWNLDGQPYRIDGGTLLMYETEKI